MTTPAQHQTMARALGWDGLQALWQAIQRQDTPGWEPGRAFEYLVLRMFELDGARVRWPYFVKLLDEDAEEIDGAVYCNGLACLVESKDTVEKVGHAPLAKLRNQLLRRPAGTVGLLFSRSSFTDGAKLLAHFTLPQAILLWNGEDVAYALSQRRICDFLSKKYVHCVEEGKPHYDLVLGEVPS